MKEYNEAEVRGRFLEEVARLKDLAAFEYNKDFCEAIKEPVNFLSEIERFKISTKMLYYSKLVYNMDIQYVVFGVRSGIAPGPIKDLKELSKQGKHLKKS